MKKEIFAILILVVYFWGCSGRGIVEERISQARELLATNPAEAESILHEVSSAYVMNESQKADVTRYMSIAKLRQGKTYVMEPGLEQAIAYYKCQADTTALLTALQLAFVRERWLGEQDSAAMYLQEALGYATDSSVPDKGTLYIELSNLYAQPLLRKDYMKGLGYVKEAMVYDHYKGRALHDSGLFYDFMGETDSAKYYMEKALEITSPENPDYETFALNYAANKSAGYDKINEYLGKIEGKHLGKIITLGFVSLNHNKITDAAGYFDEAWKVYNSCPEKYSVNTYNNLRLLKGCIDYARHGEVNSGDGTLTNDSIGERLSLDRKIKAERAEYNDRLRIKLLESESKRQKVWIVCLSVLMVIVMVAGCMFWRNRQSYIKMRKELEEMRLKQIVCESDAPESSSSFLYISERARICTDRFRKTGGMDIIQRGETLYEDRKSFLPLKERTDVKNLLLECFADFIVDLRIDAGKMTMEDIVTCLLSLMRMNNAAIASCIGCSDGAVRTRKTRLKSRISDEMAGLIFA